MDEDYGEEKSQSKKDTLGMQLFLFFIFIAIVMLYVGGNSNKPTIPEKICTFQQSANSPVLTIKAQCNE